jgi:hypothetical protein
MLNAHRSRCWLPLAMITTLAPIAFGAEPTLTIRTRDGRTATGPLVERPDAQSVRITSTAGNAIVSSRFAWTEVAELLLDGESLTTEALLDWSEKRSWPARPRPVATKPRLPPAAVPAATAPHLLGSRRVESLVIAATPAQWNADPLPDGLLVRIVPRDGRGTLVPVRGELTLVLRGFRHHEFHRNSFRLEPKPVDLQTVTALLTEADFADGPAVVRLPFEPGRPDRDFRVEPTCLLTARLGVPTQGVFEAVSPVLVRPWDPLVDRLPYYEGRTDPFRLWPERASGSAR